MLDQRGRQESPDRGVSRLERGGLARRTNRAAAHQKAHETAVTKAGNGRHESRADNERGGTHNVPVQQGQAGGRARVPADDAQSG